VKQDTGLWLALKGLLPTDELAALAATRPLLGRKTDSASALPAVAAKLVAVEPVKVPGLDESRCLVWLKPEICLDKVGG
jgi:hypothetical protein